MFEALVKSKFFNKCKSATKLTKTRLEMIKKKRNAMQKFLKNDIVDLLKNGLDINAYGRAEGLLVELNLTSCYEFVETFCVRILNNVSVMDKQRECPENCLEAVSSLIFAAARFADLPELRNLRSIFTERYGASLDHYVNKEFADKLKLEHPTKDMKLQLMEDIAQESGVEWNCNAAKEKMFNHHPRAFNQVKNSVTADDEFQAHRNVDDSPRVKYTEHPLSSKIREQHPEEMAPFNSFVRERKKEVDKENVEDKENSQTKPIPPPPYRRLNVDQTRNDDEVHRVAELLNRLERGDKKLKDNSVTRSTPGSGIPESVRRTHSKVEFNDDVVGVLSERKKAESGKKEQNSNHNQLDEEEQIIDKLLGRYSKKKSPSGLWPTESDQKSVMMRHASWNVGTSKAETTSVEKLATKKGHHIRSTSAQTEIKKLPDYDDLVARLATFKEEYCVS